MRTLLFSCAAIFILLGDAEWPLMKDGLWSIHTVSTMMREGAQAKTFEVTVSRCRTQASDTQVPASAPPAKDCKVISKSSRDATHNSEMQCTINGSTVKVKETVTMKGDNEANTITEFTFDPPNSGLSGMNIVADMKYLGPCPAEMQPGDTVMPDGKVVHPPGR